VARLIALPTGGEIVTTGTATDAPAQTCPPTARSQPGLTLATASRPSPARTPVMTKAEYGQDELREEIARWVGMTQGARHRDLLRVTMSLAGLVKAGCLTDQDAIGGLRSVGESKRFSKRKTAWRDR